MPVQTICTVAENRRLNDCAWALTLDVDPGLYSGISCGQFIHIKCGDAQLLRRPISICDWEGEGSRRLVRVVFEIRGEGTLWLSRQRPGDRLDVLGPLGHGFDLTGKKKLLLAGGGVGAPPLLGCAKQAAAQGCQIYAALGFRSMDHQMLTGEFAKVCADLAVISDDGSTGRQGVVTRLVEEWLDPSFDGVLACGPKPMLRAVAGLAQSRGVPCQVSLEERMGCGVGACLVCACDMADGSRKHVCKDGPVFDAREVDWNA